MDLAQPPARAVMLTHPGQQQRPSLSYFVFLSILFFMISNNNGPDMLAAGNPEGEATLQRMRDNLAKREGKRQGLATWLGVEGNQTAWEEEHGWVTLENGTWAPGNDSATVVEFLPEDGVNPVLLPGLKRLMVDSRTRDATYHQNLTGFVRGEWKAQDWSLAGLGLAETFETWKMERNTTAASALAVEAKVEEAQQPAPRVEDNPASPAVAIISRRQLNSSPPNDTSSSPPPPPPLVNTTTTHNRTQLRHDFPFLHAQGGKVSFNLREEQGSAVGALKPLGVGRQDGQLLEMDRAAINESWQGVGPATYLRGDVTLSSHDGAEDLVLDIEGMHFLSLGTFYAYATPSFVRSHLFDAVGLPLLGGSAAGGKLGNDSAHAAGHVALREVDKRLEDDRKEVEDGVIRRDAGLPDTTSPHCIFTLYGSLSPLPPSLPPALYAESYASLFHPTGSSIPSLPPATVSYTLYSENCGLVISGEAEALATASLWNRATGYASLMGVVQLALVLLLVRQMERAGPGASSKIAYTTIAVQAAMDSYFFIIQFTVGIVTSNRSSLPILVPAFFALVSSLIFGMRYAASIRQAAPPPTPRRAPVPAPAPPPPPPPPPEPTQQERAAQAAERRAAAAGDEEAEGEGEGEETPLVDAVPAPTPAPAVQLPEQESDWPYILGGLGCAVFAGTIIVVWGWMGLILLLIYSYWLPQIVLNVQRGAARQTLRREYIIGTTLCRLVLPTYFWGYGKNVLAVETSPWIFALILYSCTQALILLAQDTTRLGARFFLPSPLLTHLALTETESWDYHPLPPSSHDLEAGSATAITPHNADGTAKEDCPICLSEIQILPAVADKERAERMGGGLEVEKERQELRWGFMVPPCGHVAHTECLESWMAIKSVCPSCRARLPPL